MSKASVLWGGTTGPSPGCPHNRDRSVLQLDMNRATGPPVRVVVVVPHDDRYHKARPALRGGRVRGRHDALDFHIPEHEGEVLVELYFLPGVDQVLRPDGEVEGRRLKVRERQSRRDRRPDPPTVPITFPEDSPRDSSLLPCLPFPRLPNSVRGSCGPWEP